ncbi:MULTISPECIES: hypothetical protein [Cryobacterium]|uniref:Uncharacterized protein n=1 Tax=Cryobacterium breve TaxID=1259258 RepID=A0ABY2JAU7_9MICO|nr:MULTISPECIES: hypothetical protein [Cryobacterium]TFC94485.1 hypothetical protein E3T20_08275 [Cryobacterium sp. TmT3-12]TFD01961.1 hypothetical protein E3O65_00195 [Cryobacterium breve]
MPEVKVLLDYAEQGDQLDAAAVWELLRTEVMRERLEESRAGCEQTQPVGVCLGIGAAFAEFERELIHAILKPCELHGLYPLDSRWWWSLA